MSSSPVRPSPGAGGSSPMRFSSPTRGSVRGTPRSNTSQVPRTPSSVMGTPQRAPAAVVPAGSPSSGTGTGTRRGDIGSARGFSRPRGMDSDEKGVLSTDAMPAGSVLWGTSVNVHSSMKAIEKFFLSFKEAGQREPKYPRLLQEMIESNTYNINVDCSNLHTFDRQLYRELVSYPSELVPLFDLVIHEIITKKFPDVAAERTRRTQVRTFNLQEIQNMRELNPVDIDKMIAIKGMVIRASSIIPDLRTAFFQCTMCNNTAQVGVDRGRIQQPTQCTNCRTDNTMQPIHNRGFFADKQLIKIQETPDTVPEGETPHTVNVFAFDDLVDVVKPGDRVEITGIYKARAVRMNPRKRNVMSVYSTYVDAIHFKRTEKGRVGSEHPSADPNSEFYTSFDESDAVRAFSAAEEKKLRALAASGDVYDKLTRSVAPSIYQLEDVKKGILCQLFGGANKDITGHGRFRGELNILLCGDPGTSKSQMLQYVHKLAPRGIYTSGKGNSAVGLTAYITKDNDTGELVLESGALVLSDRGICCIDEFDKMSDSTRSVLHEVMEQQTVSIAKAGIVCSLNARTAILASANPKGSRYNPKLSVVDNIMLPPTLLSRFDLIYLILDKPNELSDRRLARHLVSLYYDESERDTSREADLIPTDLLSKYISFARRTVQPVIGDDAVQELINGYVEMRRVGQHNAYRKVVTATPRQLESLIRLSEALARMRLADRVDKQDVQEARRLMSVATQSAATDPTTGLIDMDLITTGHSAAERKRTEDQIAALKDVFETLSGSIKYPALLKRFNENTSGMEIDMQDLRQITEIMLSEGYLIHHGRDALKRASS